MHVFEPAVTSKYGVYTCPRNAHSVVSATLSRRRLPVNTAQPAPEPRTIHWVEANQPENGHGVQFRHDDLPSQCIAFLEGFDWQNGGPATVRLLAVRPRTIAVERWPSMVQSAFDTVIAFLTNQENVTGAFRQGAISVLYNG